MLKGFKEFLLRGNVIDLAVAVVVGATFTAIINAVVENVFNPLIGALFQADSLANSFIINIPLIEGTAELKFGAVLAALIQFVLTAAVLYFAFVLPINQLKKIQDKKKSSTDSPALIAPNEVELLTEIRDLLAKKQN